MPNTIAGANLAEIAQESLPALQSAFLPLNAFLTDFSADVKARGESVTTRFPTVPTAQNLASGYTRTDVAMTSIKVDLDTYFGFVWGFNDVERSKSSIMLNDLFVQPAITAISAKVFGDLWALVNNTNYPIAAATNLIVTASNFDRDKVVDIATQLTLNKVPKFGRSLILHPNYYGALAKDLNAADSAGQVTTLGENRIPRIAGFDVYESDAVSANAQNVQGLACYKSNILMAARTVDAEGAAEMGATVETVVLPELGLPVQFRRWYDLSTGNLMYSMGVLYGVKFGVPTAGLKIASA